MSREISYRAALGEALREALDADERVILMGQDIGVRGGSFGVTAGLLEAFGPQRVRDAPSAEAALLGVGIGAALAGLRPVVELTTATFAALAFDQLAHHAAPLRAFSGGRLTAPLVLRMPQGGGARLGPVHSQMIEALLHHVPGLTVAAPSTPADAKGLLAAAIRADDPVVVLEHSALYDTRGAIDEEDVAPLGRAAVRRAGHDVTIVACSRMALVALGAAALLSERHDVEAEVVDLRSVRPLDHATIAASVRRTRRVVLVEEGWPDGGVGATLAARIAAAVPGRPLTRVTGADVPMPYARTLERLAIPDEAAVVAAALALLGTRGRPGAPEHTLSAEIDMEVLVAARRSGAALADALAAVCAPLLADVGDAAITLADGTVTLLGSAAASPRQPTATLTFGPIATRPSADGGAVTIRRLAPLTLRLAPETVTADEAAELFAALRAALQGEGEGAA